VDRFDADGIGDFAPESTTPPTPGAAKKTLNCRPGSPARRQRAAPSTRVVKVRIIMGAILPQGAANTYFGQWTARILRQTPANRPFHCP